VSITTITHNLDLTFITFAIIILLYFDNININGKDFLGGLVYMVDPTKPLNNVQASNVTIVGQNNVGGIVAATTTAYVSYPSFTNFNATNMNITGKDYVGGIWGYYSLAYNGSISDSIITGNSYVGGVAGRSYDIKNYTVNNCNVKGSSNYIGGVTGYTSNSTDLFIYDSTIEGLTTSANSVGGIAGWNASLIMRSGVLNSTVISNGSSVGGLIGSSSYIYSSYVYNTDVTGLDNVGGLVGTFTGNMIQYVYSNAYVQQPA
jgi:hypothetical protein